MSDMFLPTTKKEVERLGWDHIDVIIFSGDAYIDHPSFATAVIGRVLEHEGYNVAVVPQPDWHGDLRDFKKLGAPRLFFAISPGSMDSMVKKYTANKRLRSEDAYTPDGRIDKCPEYPTIVYTQILKELYPDTPVIIGGVEASMRRLTHYDYWQNELRPSILADSGADLLVYGMGEKPIVEIAHHYTEGKTNMTDILQTAYITATPPDGDNVVVLHPHNECVKSKLKQSENFMKIEGESNRYTARILVQETKYDTRRSEKNYVVVNPPYPPLSTKELDNIYDLPYTRLPHPKYKDKRIPAYDMIRHSITLHRGCFGGCAFCTISAHQGKFISSRSKESIMREARKVVAMPDFKGYISDMGGPSANMYGMHGRNQEICKRCKRPSCLHPTVCKNLQNDHTQLIDIYRSIAKMQKVKKCCVGSGVRYDLVMSDRIAGRKYADQLIRYHVSGRLKVAPEHTEESVLNLMRKPPFELFYDFKKIFDSTCHRAHLKQQIIPYFISAHPGCTEQDMIVLSQKTRQLGLHLEQVQEFTPTPMTLSTEMYYTGINPYTGDMIYSAKSLSEKKHQHGFFFGKPMRKTK